MATPRPTSATRNCTMMDTFVTYVRAQIRVNVFRIDAAAIRTGVSIAGIVPKTKSRMTSEPAPPISASVRTLGPPDVVEARVGAEARLPRRVEGGEGRVPVAGDVGEAAGREVGRGAELGELLRDLGERVSNRGALRHIAGHAQDGDVRRLLSGAERVQRALVRLI